MRTRSSGPVVEPSTTPRRRRNKKSSQQQVDRTIVEKPVVMMADTRTMAELLRAPTKGNAEAIVVPTIPAEHFELKHSLLNLVTSKQFFGFKKEDPHAHIRWFNKISSTMKYKYVPDSAIKLMLFPFSIDGPHPYYQCPATNGNAFPGYQDNIQAYVSVAAVNCNQGNAGHRPPSVAHQVRPPVECLALADLGASINLMPLSIWRKLSLPELTPTQMILELADRSTTRPTGIAEDVFVRVGKFHFLADFELTPPDVSDEATNIQSWYHFMYSYNDAESINRIDVIDIACEEYSQEVLGFSDNSESGNPTPISEPIIAKSSPSFTLFEGGDFILEEIEAYLASDSVPPGIDDTEFDPEGDIRLIEEMLNNDPYSPLPLKDLKCEELKSVKSSIDEPPELELKDLPSHLEYAFLEGTNKLSVIIAKNLKDEEKERLIKVLKSHKQAIAWKLSDIKGIDP
ncbi:reverse transcriptase domain-containing protein [Tanacetum coccineum]|uniref:Reverse transcriptase domain-containing protein n=1 Tax=Tanacetum coccineum TaxID=301880 RepID=A0ABQ5B8J6_9ASTR